MNKKSLLISLLVLLVLVAGYFLLIHRWNGPDNEFHIADAKLVGKVEIERMAMAKSESKITLERGQADAWTVNGQFPANESKIADFLKTLMEIRVVQPVEPKAQSSALSLLKRNHIHVQVWDKEGKSMKDYLIGATNSTQTGNIFKMEYSDKCYIVSKPALDGYVSIFYSTDLLDWREKLVWNIKGSELSKISVTYAPDSSNQSYQLVKNGSDWLLDGQATEPNRVGAYTESFQGKVFAESFADAGNPGMLDSLKRRTPEAFIHLEKNDGSMAELSLFVRPDNQNNFFGYREGAKELITVQHFVIDKFLKTRQYFLAGPGA